MEDFQHDQSVIPIDPVIGDTDPFSPSFDRISYDLEYDDQPYTQVDSPLKTRQHWEESASQDDIPRVYKCNELPSKFETWNDLMDFIEYHKECEGKQTFIISEFHHAATHRDCHEACIVEYEIGRNFIHAKCLEELRKVRKSLTISSDKASKLTFALHRLNAEFAGFDLIEVRNALFELIRVNSKP